MTTMLVTGGSGFIGSCFIRYELKKHPEYKIINLDALTYSGNPDNLKDIENNPNYTFIHGNICDLNLVKELVKKSNYVINFAAETHVDNSIEAPDIFVETNIKGTLNLLLACKEIGIEKYLQISTDEVYGSLNSDEYFYETSPIAPNSPYSASKAGADMLVRAFGKTYNLPIMITRSSNNYGPYQYPEKLIPFFISRLLKGEKLPLYGNGLNIRDWLYVYDNCEAIDLVIHKGRLGEVYNICSNNEKTNLEIARIILNVMGKDESFITYIKDRPAHDIRYTMSNNKIKSELGWCPSHKFEDEIQSTINWYIDNREWLNNVESKQTRKG